jgi:transcriptional regulator with XRE-family HTH domain
MTAADLIRTTREAAGLRQVDLAARCHTAQSAISRLESGHVSPTVETLERILRAAGAELILTTKEHPCRA